MNNDVIRTTSLSYTYSKNLQTLKSINLQVDRGNIYGFLGPNGSGKTTTLRLLLGLLKVQQGTIRIFGEDINKNRSSILRRVGSLIETPSLYGHLNALENLEVYRHIYGTSRSRVTELLRLAGLEDAGRKPVKSFSLGMKQRLSIALALLPDPELLILDEPSNGLDPNGIIELRELIKKLNSEEGMTIIISSHILAEVEKMVSHVGIISNGEITFQGSLQELTSVQEKRSKLLLHTSDNDAAMRILEKFQPQRTEHAFSVVFDHVHDIAEINRTLLWHDLDVYLLQPKTNDLEQLFIELTATRE